MASSDLLVSEIFTRVRLLLNDPDTEVYTDASLYYWLNDAIYKIRTARPESKLDSNGDIQAFTDLTTGTDILPFDEDWSNIVVNYMCYRGFDADKPSQSDPIRADIYKRLFENALETWLSRKRNIALVFLLYRFLKRQ